MQTVKTHVGTRLALALAVTGGLLMATGASAQVIPLALDAGEDEAVTAVAVGTGVGVAAAVAAAGGNGGLPEALQGSGVGSAPSASAVMAAGVMSVMGGSGGGTTTTTTTTTLP